MSKYQARVDLQFGEFMVSFESIEDLESNLQSIDIAKIVSVLNEKFGAVIKKEPKKPKPGFEDVYRFTDEGIAELLVSTQTNVEAIGLSLFAYDPVPASLKQTSWSSGVEDPDALIRQPQYKKYFIKSSGCYQLSREGKEWVLGDILPILRADQKESEQ